MVEITPEEREEAISYLIEQVSEGVLHAAFNQSSRNAWWEDLHFGMGLWVRKTLRQRFDWDDLTLDGEWAELISEAARRYMNADLDADFLEGE